MTYPILNTQFFDQFTPPVELYTQLKDSYEWSERILPLYQWDDIVYIGCSQEFVNFSIENKKTVLVFCDPKHLSKTWDSFNATAMAATPIPVAQAASGNFFDDLEKTFVAVKSNDQKESLLEASDEETVEEESSTEEVAESSEEAEVESLPGFDEIPKAAPLIELNSAPKKNVLSDTISSIEPAALTAEPVAEAASTSIDPKLKEILIHYDRYVVLLTEGQSLVAWKWSGDHPESLNTYEYSNPSPFRIVAKTQKPYHGYVVNNPSSELFFGDWNNKIVPKFFTVVPILIDDNWVGLVAAFANEVKTPNEALIVMETSASEVSAELTLQLGHKNSSNSIKRAS